MIIRIALLAVVAALGGADRQTLREKPALTIDVEDFWRALRADEVAAMHKYGWKPIEVTGTLDEITWPGARHPTLWLRLPIEDKAPGFTKNGPAGDELRAAVGHRVRIWCAYATHLGDVPYLYDCELAAQPSR